MYFIKYQLNYLHVLKVFQNKMFLKKFHRYCKYYKGITTVYIYIFFHLLTS